MQKPSVTNQIDLYAVVCACLCLLLQILIVTTPKLLAPLFGEIAAELPWKWRGFLLLLILIRIAPLGGFALWRFLCRTISSGKAMATVILAPILYVTGLLIGSSYSIVLARFTSGDGKAVIAAYQAVQSAVNLFTILGTASLVLTCCAGAIELYVIKHTPSDGERKEASL